MKPDYAGPNTREDAVKIKRIEHVAIAVRNLDRARETFAALGLPCTHEEVMDEYGVRLAMLPVGESALELLESNREGTQTSEWLRTKGEGLYHICLEVDDIDAALAELKAKGVKLRDEVARIGHGGARIAFIEPSETANVLVELAEMPVGHGAGHGEGH